MSIRSAVASIRDGLLAIFLCAASAAHAADFKPLGSLPDPNTFGSAAHAVTADGRTIAGESVVSSTFGGNRQAVFWRNGVGPTTVSPIPGSNAFTALSADGAAAIGNSRVEGSPPNSFAFYWSQFTGTAVPGHPDGYVNSTASAISADGGTMVGSLFHVDPFGTPIDSQAARGSRAEGLFFGGLGYLPGGSNTSSRAIGVSADGSVIVGVSTSANSEQEGFRWTSATGMAGLGFLPGGTTSAANFVSDDGQVIVGQVGFAYDPSRHAAFRWTEAAGMTDLGVLPGAVITWAQAMSRDGRFVAGMSGAEAFRWSEAGGIMPLGRLPGDQQSSAIAVSNDGAVVLGRSFINGNFEYFVWTEADGLRSLRDLLAASGVDVSAWGNLQAAALSNDGNTIVGQGVNPSGYPEGWVIRLQGNRAPVASIGFSPQFPPKRTPITFWGTDSTDPDGDEIVNYRWDFGDGTTAVGPVVSHTYPDALNYTVTLVVSDGKLDSAPTSVVVAIFDQMPIANAGGPYSGPKNAAIRFDGSRSTDPDADPLTYTWDFGDGTTGTGAAPTHAYARSGGYTVTLVVSDGWINSIPARVPVTVTNAAPVALLSGPTSGFKLTALTWNGSGSSDANGDALSYIWNFGDGSSATTSTPTTTHSYAAVGSYRVTLTVNDGETSSSPATADVAIQSRPPIANAGPDRTVVQRTAVGLNGAASTDPDGAIASVRWLQVAGPAVTLSGGTTLSPTFVAPRVTTLTKLTFELTVTDNDGVSSSDRVDVNVVRR
jgi:probable HAF family extracellular repeat protein